MPRPFFIVPAAFAAGALLTTLSASSARAQSLAVGSDAPKLAVTKWVKGQPVIGFEKGKTYVVEFWATWCGPCKVSIPHLTEMQKEHPDVTFVGVSVWESDQAKVAPFVQSMGGKMDYRVAMDDVPAGKNGSSGVMAKSWMSAAGQDGIPTAFIINGDGKVAWIGHPMMMEQPLAKVVSGKWDLVAAAAEFKKRAAVAAKQQSLQASFAAAKTPAAKLTFVNKTIAENPEMEENLAPIKMALLSMTGGDTAAYLAQLTRGALKDNGQALNDLAWGIVDPSSGQKSSPALKKSALAAAQRANTLSDNKDPNVLDTLAAAYAANGDSAKALEVETRAMTLDKGQNKEFAQRVAHYKKAVQAVAHR